MSDYSIEETEDIYIADHLLRYEIDYRDNGALSVDSLNRIASAIGIPIVEGQMTISHQYRVWEFIERFKSSQCGVKAIAEVREARANGYRQSLASA